MCLEGRKSHIFVPCGHVRVCQVCAHNIMANEREGVPYLSSSEHHVHDGLDVWLGQGYGSFARRKLAAPHLMITRMNGNMFFEVC